MVRGRPPRCRRVSSVPEATYFKPAGIPMRILEEVSLSVDEAEAIRLKDLEGLEQEEGADKMGISRPTFQRILASARQKMADALLNGKALRIEGGNYELVLSRFRCSAGHEWETDGVLSEPLRVCPVCNTSSVLPAPSAGQRESKRQKMVPVKGAAQKPRIARTTK